MAIDKELRIKITQQKVGTAIIDLKNDVALLEKELLKVRTANLQIKKDQGASSQEFVNGKKLEIRTLAELSAQKKLLSNTEKLYASEIKKSSQEALAIVKKNAEEKKRIEKEFQASLKKVDSEINSKRKATAKEEADFKKKTSSELPAFVARNEAKATAYQKAESEKRVKIKLEEIRKQNEAEIKADKERRSDPAYIAEKVKENEAFREKIRLQRELNRELERQRNAERVSAQFRPVIKPDSRDSKLLGQSTDLGSINALKQQIKYFKDQRNAVATNTPEFANLDQKVKSLTTSLKEQTGTGKRSSAQLLEMGENITVVAAGIYALTQKLIQFGKATFEAAQEGAEFEILYNHFVEVNGGIDQATKNLELFKKASAGNLSDEELIKYSNGMTSLGYSTETTTKLLDIAEKQGDKTGVSFETANSALEKFITTGAARGLIELGINVGTVHDAMEKVSGKTTEEIGKLDELEQQTIRTNAITSEFGDTLDNIGNKTGDNADKITELGKKYDNLVLLLKVGVANAFSTATSSIDTSTESIGKSVDKIAYYGSQLGNIIKTIYNLPGVLDAEKFPDVIKQGIEEANKLKSDYENKQLEDSSITSGLIQRNQNRLDALNKSQKDLADKLARDERNKDTGKSSKGSKTTTKEKDPYEAENKAAQELIKNIQTEIQLLEFKKSKYKDISEILNALNEKESDTIEKVGVTDENKISFYNLQKKLLEDISAQHETELDKQEKITAEIRKQLEINKDLPGAIEEQNKKLQESLKIEEQLKYGRSLLEGKTGSLNNLSKDVKDVKSQSQADKDEFEIAKRKSVETLSNMVATMDILGIRTDSAMFLFVSKLEKGVDLVGNIVSLLDSLLGGGNGFGKVLGFALSFIPGVGPAIGAATSAAASGNFSNSVPSNLPHSFSNSNTGQFVNKLAQTPSGSSVVYVDKPYILNIKQKGTDWYYALEKIKEIETGRTDK